MEDARQFRHLLGYVSQEAIVFHDTFLNNIGYGQPQRDPAEVENAARQAAAHDFIVANEKGYHTEIGERGTKISGGQRQRLALARLFLQDASVMLLDEATSALDLYVEAQLFESLLAMRREKIIIVAAHRLSAVQKFDRIVVLHRGEVIEDGTHQELMKREGLYYNLSRLQEYGAERKSLEKMTEGIEAIR